MSADLHKFSYKKTLTYKVPNITLYLTCHPKGHIVILIYQSDINITLDNLIYFTQI